MKRSRLVRMQKGSEPKRDTHILERVTGVKLGHYREKNKGVQVTYWLEREKAKTGQDKKSG